MLLLLNYRCCFLDTNCGVVLVFGVDFAILEPRLLTITRLKKVFNFNMLYVFSDVTVRLPGDDDSIEIDENDHEECF